MLQRSDDQHSAFLAATTAVDGARERPFQPTGWTEVAYTLIFVSIPVQQKAHVEKVFDALIANAEVSAMTSPE